MDSMTRTIHTRFETNQDTVNAIFAKGITDPFAGHGGGHERYDVTNTSRELEHDDHQSNCDRRCKPVLWKEDWKTGADLIPVIRVIPPRTAAAPTMA